MVTKIVKAVSPWVCLDTGIDDRPAVCTFLLWGLHGGLKLPTSGVTDWPSPPL